MEEILLVAKDMVDVGKTGMVRKNKVDRRGWGDGVGGGVGNGWSGGRLVSTLDCPVDFPAHFVLGVSTVDQMLN